VLRFAADENFNNKIIRGVLARNPVADIVRVQDTEALGAPDPILLEWAAREGRILLTHDRETLISDAYERIRASLPMPGVVVVKNTVPFAVAIEDILLLLECAAAEELQDLVRFLPI